MGVIVVMGMALCLVGFSYWGLGGLGVNMWFLSSVLVVLFGFSHVSWEGWLMLAMANVGGILVLTVYASSTDGFHNKLSSPLVLMGGVFVIWFTLGLGPSSEGVCLGDSLVYSSCSWLTMTVSGLMLIYVMVVCNCLLYSGEGALRTL
uniref:NADH dehydrogenase subunit 6 n=1 Tax=Pomphorhynchus bulbocolli TaxID=317556 RepID=A0A806GMG8_9BILA|nr:NADH dehydrogenase subunit 6 [Pomphorhynchus bulbocolli]AFJ54186.1 NADH dehydrogenase subunit 6 [Pomphorhynchus bulbocolli]